MITELVEAERMCRELAVSLRPAVNLKIIRRPQQNSYLQNMSGLLNRFAVGHKQSCGLKAFPTPIPRLPSVKPVATGWGFSFHVRHNDPFRCLFISCRLMPECKVEAAQNCAGNGYYSDYED